MAPLSFPGDLQHAPGAAPRPCALQQLRGLSLLLLLFSDNNFASLGAWLEFICTADTFQRSYQQN